MGRGVLSEEGHLNRDGEGNAAALGNLEREPSKHKEQ